MIRGGISVCAMGRRSRGRHPPSPPRRAAPATGAGFGRPDLAGHFAEVALIVPRRLPRGRSAPAFGRTNQTNGGNRHDHQSQRIGNGRGQPHGAGDSGRILAKDSAKVNSYYAPDAVIATPGRPAAKDGRAVSKAIRDDTEDANFKMSLSNEKTESPARVTWPTAAARSRSLLRTRRPHRRRMARAPT